jgi:tetratricopeptide (TPR) repeat protein
MIGDGRYEAHEVIRTYFRRILTPTEKDRYARGILPHLLEQGRKAKATYRNDDAIGCYSNVLELQIEDDGRLEAREGLGEVLELIGQYDQALASFQSVLEQSPEADISSRIHRKMGRVRLLTGKAEKAIQSLESARELLEDEKSVEAGKLRLAFSQTLHRMRKWEESKKAANEAMEILKLHPGQENEMGKVHSILGLSYTFGEPQDFRKAEEHLLKSLDLRRKAGSLEGEAATQNNLGIAYANLGEPGKALEHLNAGVRLAEETGSFYMASNHTMTTGCVHYELLGEFDEALECFKDAMAIAENAGDEYIQCLAHRHISRTYRFKGDLESALNHSLKYLELAEKMGQAWDTMNAHLERAKEFLGKGMLSDAMLSCRTSLGMVEGLNDKSALGDCLRVEASILREQEKWKESQETFEKATALLKEAKDEYTLALAYHDFALYWQARNDRKRAAEHAGRAVEMLESEGSYWLAEKIAKGFELS